jgi:hypothetical protein
MCNPLRHQVLVQAMALVAARSALSNHFTPLFLHYSSTILAAHTVDIAQWHCRVQHSRTGPQPLILFYQSLQVFDFEIVPAQ